MVECTILPLSALAHEIPTRPKKETPFKGQAEPDAAATGEDSAEAEAAVEPQIEWAVTVCSAAAAPVTIAQVSS